MVQNRGFIYCSEALLYMVLSQDASLMHGWALHLRSCTGLGVLTSYASVRHQLKSPAESP